MKRVALAVVLLLWSGAAYAQFSRVCRTIERSTGINRVYIPFLGLARSFVRIVEPQGVFDLRVAVFEGGARRRTPADLDQRILGAMGSGWSQVVKAVSRRGAETAMVFAKPTRRGMRMMIVATERDEAAVVEIEVDPRRFGQIVHEVRNGNRNWVDFN